MRAVGFYLGTAIVVVIAVAVIWGERLLRSREVLFDVAVFRRQLKRSSWARRGGPGRDPRGARPGAEGPA